MACRLFGAKPLSKPMLGYCQWDPQEQTSIEIRIEVQTFSFTEMYMKISSAKWWPFCPGRDELITCGVVRCGVVWCVCVFELLHHTCMSCKKSIIFMNVCSHYFGLFVLNSFIPQEPLHTHIVHPILVISGSYLFYGRLYQGIVYITQGKWYSNRYIIVSMWHWDISKVTRGLFP